MLKRIFSDKIIDCLEKIPRILFFQFSNMANHLRPHQLNSMVYGFLLEIFNVGKKI